MRDEAEPFNEKPDSDIYLSKEAGTAAEIIDSLAPNSRQKVVGIIVRAAEAERQAREQRERYYNTLMGAVKESLGEDARRKLEESLLASVAADAFDDQSAVANALISAIGEQDSTYSSVLNRNGN